MIDDGGLSSVQSSLLDEEEYAALFAIFQEFIDSYNETNTPEELLEALSEMRFEHLIGHAFDGFDIGYDEALSLLKAHNSNLTKQECEKRDILVAAVNNLIEFAVAEEYQMMENLPDHLDESNYDEYFSVFERYNKAYSSIENADVWFAMTMAAKWLQYSDNTLLTYTTQGDNRVRPWHMTLEGISYPKREFPSWLIPPIDYGCRCFLVEDSYALASNLDVGNVICKADSISRPDFMNPIFEESVCRGGRIFSKHHPYFKVNKLDKSMLRKLVKQIKKRWLSRER